MPLQIITGDITLLKVDAIVNAAKNSLLGGGGVDGCIHRAAGPALLEECRTLGGCETGSAKVTSAYNLPSKYVIHTVGPVWSGGGNGEEELLRSCYISSLRIAKEKECTTIAFPLISAGAYGYPKAEAQRVATRAIIDFLEENESDMLVYLVFYNRTDMEYSGPDFSRMFPERRMNREDYIPNLSPEQMRSYEEQRARRLCRSSRPKHSEKIKIEIDSCECCLEMAAPVHNKKPAFVPVPDESFQQMLFRFIDRSGMTDVECYNRSNISRKLFSKIRSDEHYRPSKTTVIALAIGLKLSRADTDELLNRAGFALSKSMMGDQIVAWFIENGDYNIFAINEALFEYDQPLLGSN